MTGSKSFPSTDLYGVTAAELSLGRSNVEVVGEMIKAGIEVIQYREKERSMREKYLECLEIRRLTREAGVTLIINDHLDLALAVEADGLHLGQDDLPLPAARKLAGRRLLLGISTHSPDQARAAADAGADYLGVGPIFATRTKKDVCAPVGLEYLDYVAHNITLPFVAIGGIKEHNIALVRAGGARCCALVSEIVGAPDIIAKVRALREKNLQDQPPRR
jgi:thiamine-phosphate pyrophosphorylase